MKPLLAVCLGTCVVLPAYTFAGDGTVACGAVHFIRAQGTEFRDTVVSLRNLDLVNPTIVERITVRNTSGDEVHDSGPATFQNHPLNTDYTPPLDITSVPPGASYYIGTNHIWPVGVLPTNPEQGQNMTITLRFSKEGKTDLFRVDATSRSRERVVTPTGFRQGAERSRDGSACVEIKSSDGG